MKWSDIHALERNVTAFLEGRTMSKCADFFQGKLGMGLTPLSVRLLLFQPTFLKSPKLDSFIPPALKIASSKCVSTTAHSEHRERAN
jgi:hypothetical protein